MATAPRNTCLKIAETLRSQIQAGHTEIPSEAALMTEHSVSRGVVRRALKILSSEGLIRARQGFGWYVRVPGEPEPPSLKEQLLDRLGDGSFAVGDPFLSEAAVCTEYDTNRAVARRVLAEMAGAGLIEAMPGKGRFVRALPSAESRH
ncbi:GntR family transcriptional regulator [Streptomyces sp. NPDC001941]|uniref:GntR family transcriptional regulator n=1 Tax=Streptomyces sp. NPDC001941 TaxID=3154659 RepID=UPI003327A252